MPLNAKPSEGYTFKGTEWTENVRALSNFCQRAGYSNEAIAGMLGNANSESGMNPWRWQGDTVNYNKGYGLFQYTPASGYINGYGKTNSYYAPNLSVTTTTGGANALDGYAQIGVIAASGKYFGGGVRDSLLSSYVPDCTNYKTLDTFKTVSDVESATYLWLGYFEMPGWWQSQSDVKDNFQTRLDAANAVYEIISGTEPEPEPEPEPTPTPTPTPTPVKTRASMPIYFYLRRRC